MGRAPPVLSSVIGGELWRTNAERIYEYLRRDMTDARRQRLLVYPDTGSGHIQRTVPLIYRLARELSTLYLRKPARLWKGLTEAQSKIMRAEYVRKKVNRRFRTAQEHLSVLCNATVWVWLTSTGYRLIVPPVHQQWVVMQTIEGQDIEDVAEWWLRLPVPVEGRIYYALACITPTRATWEDGPSKKWRGVGIWTKDGSNPFGRIPVALMRGSDPGDGTVFAPVPQDLLDAQRAANHDFTDNGEVRRKQGFGQAYLSGVSASEAKKIQVGPEKVVGLKDKDAKFGFASPQPDLAGATLSLKEYLSFVIATNGMNPATVMKSAGITALAKIIEIMDREVERIRAVDEFEAAEQTVFELMAMAMHIHNGYADVVPFEDIEVAVEYREPIQPADPTSDAQAKAQRIGLKLDSSASILATEKGISIEEGQALAKLNDELQRELVGSATPAPEAAADTPTPAPDASVETQTPAPTDGGPPNLAAGGEVQKAALNGAQVAELKATVVDCANGLIPPATAKAIILAAYPISGADVDAMLSPLDGFVPRAAVTVPAPPKAPAEEVTA